MIQRLARLSPDQRRRVLELLGAEAERTGRQPLDEVNRLAVTELSELLDQREHWLSFADGGLVGYAVVTTDEVAELSAADSAAALVLLAAVERAHPGLPLWTHGDLSAGRTAAQALGMSSVRELVLMARSLPPDTEPRTLPPGVTLDSFDVDNDVDDWLDLNRRAFAALLDQASWDRPELELRLGAPWYRSDDFLVARGPDGDMIGFHWTKVDPTATAGGDTSGEVFIIAVDRAWRGSGLGAALLDQGLWHLTDRGMTQVHLFVDADNGAAIKVYESAGFSRVDGDRRFEPVAPA
ncbi:MAG: mycothiol synthase [Candidatus Nanopelagicales bacterium]